MTEKRAETDREAAAMRMPLVAMLLMGEQAGRLMNNIDLARHRQSSGHDVMAADERRMVRQKVKSAVELADIIIEECKR